MDIISAPGGFLGSFLLTGIMLPIVLSFVLDGIVFFLRGRGATRLLLTTALSIIVLALAYLAWQNGIASIGVDVHAPDTMNGAAQLVLLFSIPASLLGFGARMLTLFLNPGVRAQDLAIIVERKHRREARARRALRQPSHVAA